VSRVTIDELLIADEPDRWAALGFTVEGERCRVGAVGLRFTATESPTGIVGWSLRGAASTALDGLATTLSERAEPAPAPVHPNGVVAIDHVVAMSPDLDRSVRALTAAGLDLRRIRDEPTAAGAPRQAFFRLGEEILEVVQEPEEVIERADGPARLWGLAFRTVELDRTVERLGERVGTVRPAVQRDRSIATLRRAAGLSVPVALMSDPVPSG
jgi:glyoxalase/bleomycin resistance protein/dioxygenase superfamily protein